MEFILYLWEKSERIYLSLFVAIISLITTMYARYEANAIASPHDLLGGTLIVPSQWLMEGMWCLTLVALALHTCRRVWMKFFYG